MNIVYMRSNTLLLLAIRISLYLLNSKNEDNMTLNSLLNKGNTLIAININKSLKYGTSMSPKFYLRLCTHHFTKLIYSRKSVML